MPMTSPGPSRRANCPDCPMSRNLQGCWTCRIRRKGDCEGPAAGGDCDVCVRLNIECLRGYGERLPVEYRRQEIVEPLSRWNRTRAGRAGGQRFSISKLYNALKARERSTEASSSSASTVSYSSARTGSGSRQSSQAPMPIPSSDEDHSGRPRINQTPSDLTIPYTSKAGRSASQNQDRSPITDYSPNSPASLPYALETGESVRPRSVAPARSDHSYDQQRYQMPVGPRVGESSNMQTAIPLPLYSPRHSDLGTSPQYGQNDNPPVAYPSGQNLGSHQQMVEGLPTFDPSFQSEAGHEQWECDEYVVPSNAPALFTQPYDPTTYQQSNPPHFPQNTTFDAPPSMGYSPQPVQAPAPFQPVSTSQPWQGSHPQNGVDNRLVGSNTYPSGQPYPPETGKDPGTGSQHYDGIMASNLMVPPHLSAIGAAYPFAQGLPQGPIVFNNPQWFQNLPEQCQQYCPERDGTNYN